MRISRRAALIFASAAALSADGLFAVWLATHHACWEECPIPTSPTDYVVAGIGLPGLMLIGAASSFAFRSRKLREESRIKL